MPWHFQYVGSVLLVCGVGLVYLRRRDPALLAVTVLPLVLSVAGYALFLADLDHYYYLSLMPCAVLTVIVALHEAVPTRLQQPLGMVLLLASLAVVPGRAQMARGLNRMPEYGQMVTASRTLVRRGQPLAGVEAAFPLLPTVDPEYLYGVLGGRLDRSAPWIGVMQRDGSVAYRRQ
jgi:hypothetical protein